MEHIPIVCKRVDLSNAPLGLAIVLWLEFDSVCIVGIKS